MNQRKTPRPLVTEDNIFIAVAEQPQGRLFVRRRRRKGTRGMTVSVASPRELEYVREHFPKIAKDAGV